MKKSTLQKVPTLDIPGLTSFQAYHGNLPEFILQGSRVVCLFEANNTFYDLARRFSENEEVRVLDFCNIQRQMRARMLSMRDGK